MKKKSLLYLILGVFGIAFIVLSIVLDGRVSNAVDGTLMGVGAGLMGAGISMWRVFYVEKKNPAKWKLYEIETRDERNVAIALKAKAKAGDVLQWTVLAAAWAATFFHAPSWVLLAAIGAFLFKTILEMCLMAGYQKKM